MTDISATSRSRPDFSWIIVLVAGALAAIWFLTRNEERALNQSAMGHNGLLTWLKADGVEARVAAGGPILEGDIGLRILPIHDTDLTQNFFKPDTQEEYLKTGTEIDIRLLVVQTKLNNLKTLVIAPKWTRAVRHSGYAHPTLLIPLDEAGQVFRMAGRGMPALQRPQVQSIAIKTLTDAFAPGTATLYAPQLFDPDTTGKCEALIGNALGNLLVRCKGGTRPFYALSDPDLMNNHGLSLGDNAVLVRDVLRVLADGKPILLDNTKSVFVTAARPALQRREWSDLARFFSYPFSLIWLGLVFVSALALWRSSVRFGPPDRFFNDIIGASKSVSISTKARLLRLSGNDAALLERYIRNRIGALAAELLGRVRAGEDPLVQIANLVKRRDPELAMELSAATAAALTPPRDASTSRLLDLLDAFESKTEKVLHEFGRNPIPR